MRDILDRIGLPLLGYLGLCLVAYAYVQWRRRRGRRAWEKLAGLADGHVPELLPASRQPCPIFPDGVHGYTVAQVRAGGGVVQYVRRCVCGAGAVSDALELGGITSDPPRLVLATTSTAPDRGLLTPFVIELPAPPKGDPQ